MTRKLNFPARMVVAFQNYGCVILIMIVVMILMSQHICVVKGIVQLDGNVVQANRITDAYPNGCFVMGKTIVGTIVMSYRRTALSVRWIQISSVTIIDVYLSMPLLLCLFRMPFSYLRIFILGSGHATFLMIVAMVVMRLMLCAKGNTEIVLSPNFVARMVDAYHRDGDAIMRMTVAMDQTRWIAKVTNAKMAHSNALLVTVSHRISVVMATVTAVICLMRLIARHGSLVDGIVPKQNINVRTTYVYLRQIFAMGQMIVVTIPMKLHQFVLILTVILLRDSSAQIIDVLPVIKFVMASITVVMAQMKII